MHTLTHTHTHTHTLTHTHTQLIISPIPQGQLSEETQELLSRIADLQQEKWLLETKVLIVYHVLGGGTVICMRLDYIPVGVGNYLAFYVVLFGGDYLP